MSVLITKNGVPVSNEGAKFTVRLEKSGDSYIPYHPKYTEWTEEDYYNSDLKWCEPMTAHALEDEAEQDNALWNPDNFIEEKFDGTRGILHILDGECRVFSRRISKKTNWFTENTDSLPQMRSINIPELAGTIIDGEMFIPNKPFKDVSSTLNCKWDKAIDRQLELGLIVFHAFDILYYKGIKLENMRLERRKYYLGKVIQKLKEHGVESIVEVPYFKCDGKLSIPVERPLSLLKRIKGFDKKYPTLYSEICISSSPLNLKLSPRGYYEFIVATGGEGVIIKNKDCKYVHKRDKAYLKIKKFYTREAIILGFTEPTKEYKGKFPNDSWEYWEKGNIVSNDWGKYSAKELLKKGYTPVTKYYYENWVGNIIFGVIITDDEIKKLPKNKKFNIHEVEIKEQPCNDVTVYKVLEVGECAGFDEEVREKLSEKDIGKVIEVKCNEIFKDTGKLRHPRFLRFREDKSPTECTYYNHITE